jgi:hypothetical protein
VNSLTRRFGHCRVVVADRQQKPEQQVRREQADSAERDGAGDVDGGH